MISNIKQFLVFVLALTIFNLNTSCKSQYSITELKRNFSTEEISELNKITEFFKNQMCLNTNRNFKTCYEETPHEYLEAIGEACWTKINFERQKKLYSQISKNTFSKIWSYCESIHPESKEKSIHICSKFNGKYQNYLLEYGKNNPSIKKYAERVVNSGGFLSLQLTYWQILKKILI